MAQLQITLLGGFSVSYDGEALDDWGSSKAEELLCFLLLNRDRPHARELLASALWEHATTAQSKAYLRKALWNVQTTLKSRPGLAGLHVLSVTPGWIRCNPDVDLWLDVEALETAYRSAEALPGDDLNRSQVETLCKAAALYQGDLLQNLYQEWCLYERERFRHLYFSILDKLATYFETSGQYEASVSYAEKILYYDRAREYTHRQLMRVRCLAGDRTGAVRQYESCVRALQEDLDIDPSDSTVRLFEQIRTGHFSGAQAGTYQGERGPSIPPQDLISQLKAARDALAEAQARLTREVAVLEESLLRVKG
jgi:DNA-binding SARP family transcriptional activator